MKKLFIVFLITIYASNAFSQSVINPNSSIPSKNTIKVQQVRNPNQGYGYHGYGNSRYATGRNGSYGEFITLKNIEDKIEQLKIRIKESEKYGTYKKDSLENELNHALRKFKEADYNGDGILDEKEQEVYGDDGNIFIDY